MSGCLYDRNQPMLTLGFPHATASCWKFISSALSVTFCYTEDTQQPFVKMKTKQKNPHLICWNWGYFVIEREICLLFQGSYQFNLWLCIMVEFLRVLLIIVGCYHHRLLTMSIICLDHQLKIWTLFCFLIIWLAGWSFSKNYGSMPSFELLREGSHSPGESVLQRLQR